MIAVTRLTKTYGALRAVDDFSFTVGSGEIVGLIGPNGAGKTTTLRCIVGIQSPSAGSVTIDGHDIVTDAVEAKRRLAFMADEPHLFDYLTVAEHLRLTARIYRVAGFEPRAKALLDELQLTGKEPALPGELSRGMKQKVVIACEDAGAFLADLSAVASTGAAGVVLWPFRVVARLPLAASMSDFAAALPGVLLILGLNYVWVVRSDAAFEEASAELAEKLARARGGLQPASAARAADEADAVRAGDRGAAGDGDSLEPRATRPLRVAPDAAAAPACRSSSSRP